jgi:hypothetical protein
MKKLTKKEKLYILTHYTEQHVSAGYDIAHVFGVPLSKFDYNVLIDYTFKLAYETGNTFFLENMDNLKKLKR